MADIQILIIQTENQLCPFHFTGHTPDDVLITELPLSCRKAVPLFFQLKFINEYVYKIIYQWTMALSVQI